MNDIFDLGRWQMLVTKHWYDNRKKYIFSILTIAILMLSIYILMLLATSFHKIDRDTQAGICFSGLFFVGCLYASMLFSDLGSKGKAMAYLTLPASHLEKLLCGVFYGLFAFSGIYLAIFYTLNIAAVNLCNEVQYQNWTEYRLLHPDDKDPFKPEKVVNIFLHQYPDYSATEEVAATEAIDAMMTETENQAYSHERAIVNMGKPAELPDKSDNFYGIIWAIFIGVQALFSLGSVYFGKFSFLKTCVTAFSISLIFLLLFYVLEQGFPEDMDFLQMTHIENDIRSEYRIPQWVLSVEIGLLLYVLPPLLWFVSYIRLKEKEV